MRAAALGYQRLTVNQWRGPDGVLYYSRLDDLCVMHLPNWLGCIEAALRDVWPALCAITPAPSHNWQLWLSNTRVWIFHRDDEECSRWYRARSLPELATQICRAFMAYKEA